MFLKKCFAWVLTLVLCVTACCGFTNADVEIDVGGMEVLYTNAETMVQKGYSRTLGSAALKNGVFELTHLGSGIETRLYFSGTLSAKLTYNTSYLSYYVVIDGVAQKLALTGTAENQTVELATGVEAGLHTISVLRATQADCGTLKLCGLQIENGYFLPVNTTQNIAIDFYGDSITVGYGTSVIPSDDTWVKYSDTTKAYAYLTAQALQADYNIFAYSGMGYYIAANGDKNFTMMKKLETLPYNANADIVVVNLGTNDLFNLKTEGLQTLKEQFVPFLQKVRQQYPNSALVLAWGMMNQSADMQAVIDYGVSALKAAGDGKVYSVQLPYGTSGGHGHPSAEQQAAAAEILAPYLQNVLYAVAGDTDNSGTTNLKDVFTLMKAVLENNTSTLSERADVNLDGKINLSDAALTAKMLAGWKNLKTNGTNYTTTTVTPYAVKDNLKLNGRTVWDVTAQTLKMDYTNTGIEFRGAFMGNVSIALTQNKALRLYCVVDGDYENMKEIVTTGNGNYTIAENLVPGFHHIRLIKVSMSDTCLTLTGLTFNGTLAERPADKALKIEFIGDSVTSSTSLYSATEQPDDFYRHDSTKGFAELTARNLDADVSVVSRSGASTVVLNKGDSPATKLAGVFYKRSLFTNTASTWDFETDPDVDIVVIALGTNDEPGTRDDKTAEQISNLQKDYKREDLRNGMKELMAQVRAARPNAAIVWGYEMMATNGAEHFKQAVTEFAATDGNAYYAKLMRGNYCTGVAGHPNPQGHLKNAEILTDFILKNVLG